MCGIVGFFKAAEGGFAAEAKALETLRGMRHVLQHRGPDSRGEWVDAQVGVAFGHTRLAVIDLSPAGQQPMLSQDGRYLLTFNGEIYNHLMLRQDLEAEGAAHSWRGSSDTETLLACITLWGFEKTLQKTVGMFAFAVFDRKNRSLVLARDRMGEKPLYYAWCGNDLVFASELSALRLYPGIEGSIDRSAVEMLMRFNYIPDPMTIFEGVRKLPPGHVLQATRSQTRPEPKAYWSFAAGAKVGSVEPLPGTPGDITDMLEQTLVRAIEGQTVADVPLGVLLSGGIDSSLIAALAQSKTDNPIKTFTIGFKEKSLDEAHYARAVAKHLGTDHHELELDSGTALALVTELPRIFDEPFADPSQLPTYLVSRMAREKVTVALSGDGADELFGGYSRYLNVPSLWQLVRRIPAPLRRAIGKGMRLFPPHLLGNRGRRVSTALTQSRDIDQIYLASITQNYEAADLVLGFDRPDNLLLAPERWPLSQQSGAARFMALDAMTYLPSDLLAKVDRASMAVSLETRAPYLDRDVVELAWRIPQTMKIQDGKTKWILRKLLQRHLPESLIERPKMGFGMPISDWLRGPLRDLSETYFSREQLVNDGILEPNRARQIWENHRDGVEDNASAVWSMLMLQMWLDEGNTGKPMKTATPSPPSCNWGANL